MITLAKSKAGHDKDHVYLILKEEAGYVYLVNGTTRTLDRPKKKKRMHIQIIKKLPEEITAFVQEQDTWKNETVTELLELYRRRNEDVESRCY